MVTLNDAEVAMASASTDAEEDDVLHQKVKCLIDKSIFDLPPGYKELGADAYERKGMWYGMKMLCYAVPRKMLGNGNDMTMIYYDNAYDNNMTMQMTMTYA